MERTRAECDVQRSRDEPPGQFFEPILDPFCRSCPGRLHRVGRLWVGLSHHELVAIEDAVPNGGEGEGKEHVQQGKRPAAQALCSHYSDE